MCVAGFSEEHVNEIVQLALPEKLLPPEHQVSILYLIASFSALDSFFDAWTESHHGKKYLCTLSVARRSV